MSPGGIAGGQGRDPEAVVDSALAWAAAVLIAAAVAILAMTYWGRQ